jgi:cytochrome b
MREKKKIWSIYTRLFHIMLITTVVSSYLVIEKENQLTYHVLLGYIVALLVFFRIIWGFLRVQCSEHEDLIKKVPLLGIYFKNYFKNDKLVYMGHNPASSVYVLTIMFLLVLVTVSGSVLYGIQEKSGIFASLNTNHSEWMLFVEDFHNISTTVLLVLLISHVIGVILNLIFNGPDVLQAMITGKKMGTSYDVVLNKWQHIFGVIWIASTISLASYFYYNPDNILTEDKNEMINFRKESYETSSRCGSCHLVYPAYLLPKQSWSNMMDNLENHFGKDASLPEEENKLVREYLMQNAAEHSTQEAAVKILDSLGEKMPEAITETNYWKQNHSYITKEQFEADFGIKSDCTTCHKGIRDGLIEDTNIKFKW